MESKDNEDRDDDMTDTLIVKVLDLEFIDENLYKGGTYIQPYWGRIFGGQILGQSLAAAAKTVPKHWLPHSFHCYFMRGGDPKKPVIFRVNRMRDGRSFCTRSIMASQRGKVIFQMSVQFQKSEIGHFSHQIPTILDVPPPESLKSKQEILTELLTRPDISPRLKNFWSKNIVNVPTPIEIRPCEPWTPRVISSGNMEPRMSFWVRAVGKLPNDFHVHASVLAYMADFSMVEASMRPNWSMFRTNRTQTASLDHSMWFYHDFRADEWLLYTIESPVSAHHRGLSFGHFFNREGVLVCSTAQEALIRILGKPEAKPKL